MLTKYYKGIEKFCFRDTRNADAALDITQEAYARVLAMQAAGKIIHSPSRLLRAIARNLIVDRRRQGAADSNFFRPEEPEESPEAVDEAKEARGRVHEIEEIPAPAHLQPEAVYAANEAVDAYSKAIASLPPHCREAFRLHVTEGFSDGEIARSLGISVSMVEKYLIRGRAVCKACRQALESGGRRRRTEDGAAAARPLESGIRKREDPVLYTDD
jgi:RNA polymerase sigma-70 factor (ECF subfamily)